MANNYYTFSPSFVPGTKVRSDEMNTQLSGIESGFDLLPSDQTAISRGTTFLGVESGSGNTYTVTLPDTRISYQEGDQVIFRATHTNTGASTINIDTIGAVALVGPDDLPLEANDIQSGVYVTAIYDLTDNHFMLVGPVQSTITNADLRVDWAEEWAIQPEDTPVSIAAGGDGATTFSSLHWAAKAADSETAAASSESNAATSETNSGLNVGYAAEWATKAIDSLISVAAGGDGATDYSALHWADGSAQAWAIQAEDSAIQTSFGGDGSTTFSALHWAAKAAASAAGVSLPAIGAGDAGKGLIVNPGETAYIFDTTIAHTDASNTFTSNQTIERDAGRLRMLLSTTGGGDHTGIDFRTQAALKWDISYVSDANDRLYLFNGANTAGIQMDLNALILSLTSTDITYNGSTLIVQPASEILAGKIELATQAETDTGTDDTRAVTPLKLANATSISSAGRLIDVQVFTSGGTWTKPTGAVLVEIIAIGGGGGGGGTTVASTGAFRAAGSAGGGGGVHCFNLASNLSATESVTIGTGGAGGNGATGVTGGTTQWGGGANLVQAFGGVGGQQETTDNQAGNNGLGGGTSALGNNTEVVRCNGEPGSISFGSPLAGGNLCVAGKGGNSAFGMGSGGEGVFLNTVTRANGVAAPQGYGGGGSGATDNGNNFGSSVGGNGRGGIMIIKTYS